MTGSAEPRQAPPLLTEYVTDQIRNRILLGQLRPGQRVPLDALALELGSSRVPLREAVRQLEAEGFVVGIPRRGTVVSNFDERDVRDAFSMLEHIEALAVERAAKKADATVTESMRRWARRIGDLADAPVSEEMLEAHRAFHFALFDAGGGVVLLRHLRMLWHTCERYVVLCMPDPHRRAESLREHEKLIDYIERHDADGAVRALRDHLRASLASVLDHLQAPDAPPAAILAEPGQAGAGVPA
jgi:DNA-binding GntR family transcriptional regulator